MGLKIFQQLDQLGIWIISWNNNKNIFQLNKFALFRDRKQVILMLTETKQKIFAYYEKHEKIVDLGFFLGGFVFDIFTLSQIDDLFSILQQVVYLLLIGVFLYFDFLAHCQKYTPTRFLTVWKYRKPIVHFFLGSLLSVYSLFFLKSSSVFSSIGFVIVLLILMVVNEMKVVQKSEVNIKLGLFVICLFSFYSLLIPIIVGFVGWVPFLAAIALTLLTLMLVFRRLEKLVNNPQKVFKFLLKPALSVLGMFVLFYFMGWIPPVPISITEMGVYHKLEVKEGQYILQYERPWYKYWQTGAQTFVAEPGDSVIFFVQIFSPSRFDDKVILNWNLYDQKQGWVSSDKIPIHILGGRAQGFRGYTIKKNFTSGEWRIKVETTDGREIGRLYFDIEKTDAVNPNRQWKTDIY
jgi:hypothetical protein